MALAPEAVKRGCVFIDNSSAFRMDADVPLVIAGVNDDDLKKHKGIVTALLLSEWTFTPCCLSASSV